MYKRTLCHLVLAAQLVATTFSAASTASVAPSATPPLPAWVLSDAPNTPMGVGKGLFPVRVTEATYLVNMSLVKGHNVTGVTLTAKNHYGSVNARDHRVYVNAAAHPMGSYHPFVDMIDSDELGAKNSAVHARRSVRRA